jgi:hypothetical protein
MVIFRRFIRNIISKAKAKKHKLKGNELVQVDVHVDGYHGTVDLMSTTMFIDLEVQHPLC